MAIVSYLLLVDDEPPRSKLYGVTRERHDTSQMKGGVGMSPR